MKINVIMNFRKILILLLFLLVFYNIGKTQNVLHRGYLINSVNQDSTVSGWLELISEIPIEKIWIDSLEITVAQNVFFEIEAGIHSLQVRAQNTANWFLQDVIETIEINANDTLKFTLFFPEFKMINSDPYGADILVGNVLLGQTPHLISKNKLIENQITLSKFGYKDTTLSNVDQFFPNIWITLDRDQNAQYENDKKIQLKFAQKKRHKNYALLSFGLCLASGATAYFTKKEADRNYDRYLVAGNPAEINRLYDLTERYDRIAAASYIVFEVNILASAYFFFRYLLNR